jgi:ribonuclease H2 subunit C
MVGFVLKKDIGLNPEHGKAIKVKSSDKEGFDVWEADSMFRDFTYWNHDTLPSKSDHIRSVMEWLPVSAAVSLLVIISP